LIAETDARTVQAFDFSAAAVVKPWSTTNVTLLGDALHYMPPVGGMGGNAALHDASLLCPALISVENGESPFAGGASRLRSGDDRARLPGRARVSPLHPACDFAASSTPHGGPNVLSGLWIGGAATARDVPGIVTRSG
jgi:hypothetical protein